MKTTEELLKELETLKKAYKKLQNENQKKDVIIYETNKKLENTLLILQAYEEKYNIERTKVFIPKTEKLDKIVINETEEILHEEKVKRKSNKGKKYNKSKFDYEKYVTEIKEELPEETICSTCGASLVEASKKTRYLVEIIPAKIKVVKIIKISKKCPHCNKQDNKIYYPLSKENLGGSILSNSLAAFIIDHKYELGIPFHHLADYLTKGIGFEINKQNLANYVAKITKVLEPIYNKMKEDLLNNGPKVIHSDETTLVVSKPDKENKNRKKSYVYVYASSLYDANRIRIYDFHESREIKETSQWLSNYQGVIECDNFAGYNLLKKQNESITLQKCWAHVRRRYADIVKATKKEKRFESVAYKILIEIQKIFQLEKKYKEDKLTPDEIVEKRKNDIPSIKEKIKDIVFNCNPLKKSALEEAVEYTKDCWNDLFTFVNNGYVEISNNLAEVAVKPFVLQRKVFQTAGSYVGARITGKIFSIVQTCKINNVNVSKYIEYVLENISTIPIEELLPYSKEITNKLK